MPQVQQKTFAQKSVTEKASQLARSDYFNSLDPVRQHTFLRELAPSMDFKQRKALIGDVQNANTFLGALGNTAVQTGSFGLIDRPEAGVGGLGIQTAQVLGNVLGQAPLILGTVATGGGLGLGLGLAGGMASGLGNNARQQIDEGSASGYGDVDYRRASLQGLGEGASNLAGLGVGRAVAKFAPSASGAVFGAGRKAIAQGIADGTEASVVGGLAREAMGNAAQSQAFKNAFRPLPLLADAVTEGLGETGTEYLDQRYTGRYDNNALLQAGLIGGLTGGLTNVGMDLASSGASLIKPPMTDMQAKRQQADDTAKYFYIKKKQMQLMAEEAQAQQEGQAPNPLDSQVVPFDPIDYGSKMQEQTQMAQMEFDRLGNMGLGLQDKRIKSIAKTLENNTDLLILSPEEVAQKAPDLLPQKIQLDAYAQVLRNREASMQQQQDLESQQQGQVPQRPPTDPQALSERLIGLLENGNNSALKQRMGLIQKNYRQLLVKEDAGQLSDFEAQELQNIEQGIGLFERHQALLKQSQVSTKGLSVLGGNPQQQNVLKASDLEGVDNSGKATLGAMSQVFDNQGNAYDVQHGLVDLKYLNPSNKADFTPNPNYPQELQPRDRSRASSQAQIDNIANNLIPEKLGDSSSLSEGSPIVGKDLVVESGNGRILALNRAYDVNPQKAEAYRKYIRDNAERLGLDALAIDSMEKPALIRIRQTDVNRAEFAKRANESSVAQMSPIEQAKSDADKLDATLLSTLDPKENGDINDEFIINFVQSVVPEVEQGAMVTSTGQLTSAGLKRIENALLYKAIGEGDGQLAVSNLLDSTEETSKNIGKAIVNSAPTIVATRQAIENGQLKDLDISGDIGVAASTYIKIRQNKQSVSDYYAQQKLIGDGLTQAQNHLLQVFDAYKRQSKRLESFIEDYYNAVEAQGDPRQTTLFKVEDKTPAQLIKEVASEQETPLELMDIGQDAIATPEDAVVESKKLEKENAESQSTTESKNQKMSKEAETGIPVTEKAIATEPVKTPEKTIEPVNEAVDTPVNEDPTFKESEWLKPLDLNEKGNVIRERQKALSDLKNYKNAQGEVNYSINHHALNDVVATKDGKLALKDVEGMALKIEQAIQSGKRVFGQFYDPKGGVKRTGQAEELITPLGFKLGVERSYNGEKIDSKPYVRKDGTVNLGTKDNPNIVPESAITKTPQLYMVGVNEHGAITTRLLNRSQGVVKVSNESAMHSFYQSAYATEKPALFDPAEQWKDVILTPILRINESNKIAKSNKTPVKSTAYAYNEAYQLASKSLEALGGDCQHPVIKKGLGLLKQSNEDVYQHLLKKIGC